MISAFVVADKTATRIPALLMLLRGQPLPPLSGHVDSVTAVREGIWIVLALIALGCVVLADGRRAAGLAAPSRTSGLVFGGYVGVMVPLVILTATVTVLLTQLLGQPDWIGNSGLSPDSAPVWYWLYKSAMAGIVEEIIVIAVAYRLLELIPTRHGRIPFALTGWATALLITLRLSYHCYYGLMMLAIGVMAWLTVRLYRHHRALLPMILAHFLYDVMAMFVPGRFLLLAVGVIALYFFSPQVRNTTAMLAAPFGFTTNKTAEVQPEPATR